MTVWLAAIETAGAVVRAALWPGVMLLLAHLFRTELAFLIGRIRTVSVFTPGGSLTATAAARRVASLLGPGATPIVGDGAGEPGPTVIWLGGGDGKPGSIAVPDGLRVGGFDVRHAATGAEALRLLGRGDVLVIASASPDGASDHRGLLTAAHRAEAAVVRYAPPVR